MALPTHTAHTKRTVTTVAFREANIREDCERDRQPEQHDHEKQHGDRCFTAGEHQPPGLQQLLGDVQRMGLKRPLGIIARGQSAKLLRESFDS